MFFSGSLQEGIAVAVQEAKAVVCFVQDDSETSSTWEKEYFSGDEFTRILESRSVLLRITKDSPEAGFLVSVCPISQYPTVIIIRNGMLREYLVPDIPKEDFHSRLTAALDDSQPPAQRAPPKAPSQPQQSQEANSSAIQTPVAPVTAPLRQTRPNQEQSSPSAPSSTLESKKNVENEQRHGEARVASSQAARKQKGKLERDQTSTKAKRESPKKEVKEGNSSSLTPGSAKYVAESPTSRSTPAPGPPSHYRLQVRLFDGRSVRSSFLPSQTIRKDVRPWLDSEMVDEKRPYNLKHILTPSPNRTLTIAEEDQTLQELIVGSTATFVMVPIKSYIEAYSEGGASLPFRAVSSAYELVSSVVGGATGLVGTLLGYGQPATSQSQSEPSQSTNAQSSSTSGRGPRPFGSGPNIRTLRDQRDGQDRSQFYNGNQLNFEPRRDNDG